MNEHSQEHVLPHPIDGQQDEAVQLGPVAPTIEISGPAIAFVDGVDCDETMLRHQIFTPLRNALLPQVPRFDVGHEDILPPHVLRVSLFPNVPGDVLLMFDLADRNHFRQFSREGKPLVQNFRKIVVPGNWLRRRLLEDPSLHLSQNDVVALGSPRIDYLRELMAQEPAKPTSAPLNILFAPLHDNWADRRGEPMSMRAQMEPFLAKLGEGRELRIAIDPRNKDWKRPITRELIEADIVITDYTSLAYEAWALGKPVIFPHWLCGPRILEKAPACAEAQIYRDRIGHHPDDFLSLLALLEKSRDLGLGKGVTAFMSDYLTHWQGEGASTAIARLLERMADPSIEAREQIDRAELEIAMKDNAWDKVEALATGLLLWNPQDGTLQDRLARAYNGQGRWWQEVTALEAAVALRPADAGLYYRLAVAAQRMGRHAQAAAAYAEAIRLAPKKATTDWHYRLGYVLETPGTDNRTDPRRAAAAYDTACAMDEKAKRFGVGALHAASGRWREAATAYRKRLALQPFDAELRYRLGMAHDRCYEWAEAEASYTHALALDPGNLAWHYRLGFVLERQMKFAEAALAYGHAARSSKAHKPTWFYRAGYTLEKCGRLQEACESYAHVDAQYTLPTPADTYATQFTLERISMMRRRLEDVPEDAALWADLSKQLEAVGDLPGAVQAAKLAMIRSADPVPAHAARLSALEMARRERANLEARLQHNCTKVKEWLRYSELLEAAGEHDLAIEAMQQVVLRSNEHMPAWQHRLGLLLMRAGRLEEACAAFRDQQILQRPHGIFEDKFESDNSVRFHATLREFYDLLPLEEDAVLYEVHLGHSFGCNPKAIFDRLLDEKAYGARRHVWVLDDVDMLPAKYRGLRNVFCVKRGSQLYLRMITTCKFLINNGTFPEWFVRRPGQVYLNTWHGTPIKTLGSAMKFPLVARANTSRNFVQATHMIFPNEHTRRAQIENHNVRELALGRQLVCGYPRNDQLARINPQTRATICKELGIPENKPIVLYAPTYRGNWNSPDLEADSLLDQINVLNSTDHTLIFRGHHLVEKAISSINLPIVTAPQSIDTNELLAAVDVLISDFSSIIYDFAVTGRPIILHVPDWEAYDDERGLYFRKDEVAWPMSETLDELQSLVARAVSEPAAFHTEQYKAAQQEFCAHDDGSVSDRVIAFMLSKDEEGTVTGVDYGAEGIVMRSALGTINGIASSAIALVENLSRSGKPSVLMLEAVEIRKGEVGDEAIKNLEKATSVVLRTGALSLSLEEQWLYSKFNATALSESDAMLSVLLEGFEYESRRLVGDHRFARVVDHQGYHPMWACILRALPAESYAIYLHNDMVSEAKSRLYPNLRRVFRLYDRFDSLISVSPSSHEENRGQLEKLYPKTAGRYHYVHNGIIAETVIERAAQPDCEDDALAAFTNESRYRIINLARLWPEKNQDRLIKSIRILVERGHDPVLYILGEGPLRQKLETLITNENLSDRVKLVGVRRNPFPFLKAADCHVLSSDYEGQGIVLLEAMTLGVPCVSTDIPGPQSVLNDGLGILTDLTPEALADGIEQIITGSFTPQPFDAEAYNTRALNEFLAAVGMEPRPA